MSAKQARILVLTGHQAVNEPLTDALRGLADVVTAGSMDEAIDALRREQFTAVFSDSDDFLPLERALISQQATLILNTIGEGICLVGGSGEINWINKKMNTWPKPVRERIAAKCQEAYNLFSTQVSTTPSENGGGGGGASRSKRYTLNFEDQQFMDVICSPIISPSGQVVQVVAVVWDATSQTRLQQKIDAIDKAGSELVRLDGDAMPNKNVAERLKLLEDKIISFTRDLMHFDHFAIRILDRKSNKLELAMSAGLPQDALDVELFSSREGNGISGFVAATGRSYICPDVQADKRYVHGLDLARSSLTVPLRLHDKVIGIFNIESRSNNAFNEDDRQFAEIFGRYVAIALNILNLLVSERVEVSHKVTDTVCSEVSGPLNDIVLDVEALREEVAENPTLLSKIDTILSGLADVRSSLRQAAEGPNSVLGATGLKATTDPVIRGTRVLVVDDDVNIRTTIADVLRKYEAEVVVANSGQNAINLIGQQPFDLVISDISMPDKSGYDVFAAARERSNQLPVILMTGFGYDPNHTIVRASQEGLQAVLFKPFRVQQLIAEVRRAMQVGRNGR